MRNLRTVHVLILLAGLGIRIWLWLGLDTNSDESVLGLMSLHILRGEEFPVFFWGANYSGTLGRFATVPFFLLFGPCLPALRLFPLLVSLVSFLLFWRLAALILEEPARSFARFAYAVPSMMFLPWILRGANTQALTHLFTLALFLIAARQAGNPTGGRWILAGLLSGLGIWTYPLVLPAVGIAFALMLRVSPYRQRILSPVWFGVPCLLAMAPMLVHYAAFEGLPPLPFLSRMPGSGSGGAVVHRVSLFATEVVPAMASFPLDREPMAWRGVSGSLTVLLVAAVLAGGIGSWHRLRRVRSGPLDPGTVAVAALAVHFLAYLLIYVSSGFGGSIVHRFLSHFFPFLFLGYGWGLGWMAGKMSPLAALFPALFLAMGHGCAGYDMMKDMKQAEDFYIPSSTIHAIVDHLDGKGYTRVYTGYWSGYRIMFASRERILCSSAAGPVTHAPHAAYEEAVREADPTAYVLFSVPPVQWSQHFEAWARKAGVRYARSSFGSLDVYTDLSRPVTPGEVRFPRMEGNRIVYPE